MTEGAFVHRKDYFVFIVFPVLSKCLGPKKKKKKTVTISLLLPQELIRKGTQGPKLPGMKVN